MDRLLLNLVLVSFSSGCLFQKSSKKDVEEDHVCGEPCSFDEDCTPTQDIKGRKIHWCLNGQCSGSFCASSQRVFCNMDSKEEIKAENGKAEVSCSVKDSSALSAEIVQR